MLVPLANNSHLQMLSKSYLISLVRNKQTGKVFSFPLPLTIPLLRDLRCLAHSEILKLAGKAYKRDPTTADSPVWEASFSLWAPNSPLLPKDNGKDDGTRNGTQVTRINPVLGSLFILQTHILLPCPETLDQCWGRGTLMKNPTALLLHSRDIQRQAQGNSFCPLKASAAGTTRSPSSIRIAKQTNVNHKLALVIGACHLPLQGLNHMLPQLLISNIP